MSMIISTGDDSDEIDDDLERDDDDDRDEDDEPRGRKPKPKSRDDEEDDEEDDLDDKSDEELRAEIKRLRAAVQKSNASGLRQRQKVKQLRAAQAALDGRDDDSDDEDDDKPEPKSKRDQGLDAKSAQRLVDRAVKKEREALEAQHTRDLIETRMETLFTRAGADDKAIRLLKRELDFDELELDPKTRSVEGAEEELDRLKIEFPVLFRGAKGSRRRINGGDDRDGDRKKKPMSATERQVAMLTGGGR